MYLFVFFYVKKGFPLEMERLWPYSKNKFCAPARLYEFHNQPKGMPYIYATLKSYMFN